MFTGLILIGISICLYAFVMLSFARGWHRIKPYKPYNVPSGNLFVSVLVPFRNEKENIKKIEDLLKKQNYPAVQYEIIFINDHSEDGSEKKITHGENENLLLLHLNNNQFGKKAALIEGIKKSRGDLILTTDADCSMGKNWLQTFAAYYEEHKPRMMASFVSIAHQNGIYQRAEALELAGLIASSAGSIGIKRPIMVNGANFAYAREVISSPEKQLRQEKASGDDIYLLLEQKRMNKNKIHFIKSKETIVTTKPQLSIKKLIHQRKRWASKTKTYRDNDILFTAFSVFFINLVLLITLFSGFFNLSFLLLFFLGFIVKTIIDLILIAPLLNHLNNLKLLKIFPLVQFIYPFYSVLIGLISQFSKYKWKGRTYS